jgi:hypothetical protein
MARFSGWLRPGLLAAGAAGLSIILLYPSLNTGGRRAGTTKASTARKSPPAAKPRARSGAGAKPASTPAVVYRKTVAAGVPLHVVQVDLRRPEVRLAVATPAKGIGFRDTWPALVDRVRPAAAITGTYFCTTTSLPVGSIVVGGQRIFRGSVGTALAFSPAKGAKMVTLKPGRGRDWSAFEMVLQAGPRLLTAGRRSLSPPDEGFRDPAIYAPKRRTAAALTPHGKLLLVATQRPVLLRTFAEALRRLGAADAMCLDGGGSTALYCGGRTRVAPVRVLTNVLVVYDSAARYRQQAAVMNPTGPRIATAPPARPGG